jgi:hypothetical protein
MVRPAHFGFNPETAETNAFQINDTQMTKAAIQKAALEEFDEFVKRLFSAGINVIVTEDEAEPAKPDAIFPNNWVSFHQEGYLVTYPMYAPTRRKERNQRIIDEVATEGFTYDKRIHLEEAEQQGVFLEGTGSIIFDHPNRLAYACLSLRTNAELLEKLCQEIQYKPVVFHATDASGKDIYHTNVMMAIGETFVVVCLDSVKQPNERVMLEKLFKTTSKTVIDISMSQMENFAGNMLQVRNVNDELFLVMSERAYNVLTAEQKKTLKEHTALLYAPLTIIESFGGGSARCMMAEIFYPN